MGVLVGGFCYLYLRLFDSVTLIDDRSLAHCALTDRRRILHFNVTAHPTAEWTARQLLEACGMDETPSYLVRTEMVFTDVNSPGGRRRWDGEVVTAPRSPWQNGYAEFERIFRWRGMRLKQGRTKRRSRGG